MRIILAFLICSIVACGKKKEEETTTSFSDKSKESVTSLTDLSGTLIPNSLKTTSLINPCSNTDGFFDCQPILIGTYGDIAAGAITMAKEVISSINTGIKDAGIEAGQKGEKEFTEDGTTFVVMYDIVAGDNYKIIFKQKGQDPMMHITIAGTKITVKGDLSKLGDAGTGKISVDVDYRSKTDFEGEVTFVGRTCDSSDVRAPQSLVMKFNESNGSTKAKMMLYHPLWNLSNPTCSTTKSATSEMNFYTDLVADDSHATAAIYLMPSSVTDTSKFSNYAASKFCDNFASSCSSGQAFGDKNPLTTYKNNFCVKSGDATWGVSCTESTVDAIKNGEFSAADKWILPSNLGSTTVTIPTTL